MLRRFARPAVVAAVVLLSLGALVAVFDDDTPSADGVSSPSAAAAVDNTEGSERSRYGSADGVSSLAGEAAVPVSAAVGPDGLGGAPLPEAIAAGNSRIVKTARVDLSVDKGKLAGAHQGALDAVSSAGGWVQSSESSDDQASFVLKVPVDRLDGVLAKLRGLGEVRSQSLSGQDVSAEYVDLEARLRHWRAQEAVFVALMSKAKTIGETIQIQQQLSTVQEQIEQLEGRRRQLEGQTAFSTINLSVLVDGAVAQADEPRPTTLARAWERAMGAALAVLAGTLVVLGVALPLALVLGIPALGLVGLRRRGRTDRVPVTP